MFIKLSDISAENTLKIIKDYPFSKNEDLANKYFCSMDLIVRISVVYHLNKEKEYLASMKKEVLTKRNKETGRDLSFETLKKIASKYENKTEFYNEDSSAYSSANKMGVMEDITKHMVKVSFSVPQITLRQITEDLFGTKCKYNNRQTIKPYELDLYFPQFKLAFEYDGKGWHQNDTVDKNKLCNEKNISLFTFKERSRKYLEDIKQHLVENLVEINKITKLNISEEDILFYNKKIRLPKLFTKEELEIARKSTPKYMKEHHKGLYERYVRYNPDNKDFSNLKWTREKIKSEIPKYKSKRELRDKANGLYQALGRVKNRDLKYLYDRLP